MLSRGVLVLPGPTSSTSSVPSRCASKLRHSLVNWWTMKTKSSEEEPYSTPDEQRGIFRVLDIGKPNPQQFTALPDRRARTVRKASAVDREKTMKPDQDWESVWPAARTFHPASVPLPVRQGAKLSGGNHLQPGKAANAELMKIPNFLHLTPPVVSRHCKVLRENLCTQFPAGDVESEYPLTQSKSTYLNASSSIRDHRARVVTVKVFINDLVGPEADPQQSRHFEDKLIRLVGPGRYDPNDHSITIVADSCPYSFQNEDYCDYLLTAAYFESLKTEEWEARASEADRAEFVFEGDASKETRRKQSLETLMNRGENRSSLSDYGESTRELLGLRAKA